MTRTFGAIFFVSLAAAVPSCSDAEEDGDCPEGSENCSCYRNRTCDEPFECREKRCVDPASGGSSSGTSGAGGGSDGGGGDGDGGDAGGTTGTGGAVGGRGGTAGAGPGGADGEGGNGPACEPGETRCEQRSKQACASDGTWDTAEACPFVCIDGECAGDCVPQTIGCSDEFTPRRCDQE